MPLPTPNHILKTHGGLKAFTSTMILKNRGGKVAQSGGTLHSHNPLGTPY